MAELVGWLDPRVDRFIVLRAGEQKVLEVPKHWAALLGPGLRLCFGVAVCGWSVRFDGFLFWMLLWLGWVLVVEAVWRHLQIYRDRFVITTIRIFRFTGVVSTKRATIPFGRITDSTVRHPWLGQWWGYGHLRFESAGQRQDLERVRFVRGIDRVDEVLRIISSRRALEQSYQDWTPGEIQHVLDGT